MKGTYIKIGNRKFFKANVPSVLVPVFFKTRREAKRVTKRGTKPLCEVVYVDYPVNPDNVLSREYFSTITLLKMKALGISPELMSAESRPWSSLETMHKIQSGRVSCAEPNPSCQPSE